MNDGIVVVCFFVVCILLIAAMTAYFYRKYSPKNVATQDTGTDEYPMTEYDIAKDILRKRANRDEWAMRGDI